MQDVFLPFWKLIISEINRNTCLGSSSQFVKYLYDTASVSSQAWPVSELLLNREWKNEKHCFSIASSTLSSCPVFDYCRIDPGSCTTLASPKVYFSEMIKLCLSREVSTLGNTFPVLKLFKKPALFVSSMLKMFLCKRKHRLENRKNDSC